MHIQMILTEENLVEFAKKLSMAVEGNPVQKKQVTLKEVVYENQHPVKIYPKEYPMDKKVELLKRANDAAKNI